MNINSRLSDKIEEFIRDKNIKIPDDEKANFESSIKSLESGFDNDLNRAFESIRGKLSDMDIPGGVDMNYDYADRILKKIDIRLS